MAVTGLEEESRRVLVMERERDGEDFRSFFKLGREILVYGFRNLEGDGKKRERGVE